MKELPETFEIEDLQVFEALNNPFRLRLLRRFVEPKTVKAVAKEIGAPPTRLYYHVNLMVELGILEVVQTNKVGAMVERVYRVAARSFRPGRKLLEKGHDPEALARVLTGTVLDNARVDAESCLSEYFSDAGDGSDLESAPVVMSRAHATLTPRQVERLEQQIQELFSELQSQSEEGKGEGGTEYSLTVVFVPVAGQPDSDAK
ncbi:MAG: helix-turn-helix domain-containing protein [Acidimicrobiia bacterium]